MSSGWLALDHLLPGGGYPLDAVTELLVERAGIGEISLLLSSLSTSLAARPGCRMGLIAPPVSLSATALLQAGIDCCRVPVIRCRDNGERVWCVEQMASAGGFAAFVVWGDTLEATALRRLQLAAEKAACPVFVYRDLKRAAERSPAALRLAITARRVDGRLRQRLEVLKCRGPAGACINGLTLDDDKPWALPPEPTDISTHVAVSNEVWTDEQTDVARSAFPPLGAR